MKRQLIASCGIAVFFMLIGCGPTVVIEGPNGGDGWMPNPASAGLPNPASYSVDETNDTVLDDVTGLMWQRTVSDSVFSGKKSNDYCASLVHGGFDDWRLPSRIELVSLVDFTKLDPAIDTNTFPNTPNASFWTSSPFAGDTYSAWFINSPDGSANYSDVVFLERARCVRLGHTNPSPERYQMKNGTVYDTKMKLTWQQTVSPNSFTWSQAQTYCRNLVLEGGGWRAPSMKELQTIVDETRTDPPIDPNAFPDAPSGSFWTSSPLVDSAGLSWYVDFFSPFGEGKSGFLDTTKKLPVRCVR